MISRTLAGTILKNIKDGFVNIIYGPRRVGKTTLLQEITAKYQKEDVLFLNGDTQEAADSLGTTSSVLLSKLVDQVKVVVIDEAQRVPGIGMSLKILVDMFPKKIYFASGSSSLTLSRGIQEPLTGRSMKYRLYPLSTTELTKNLNVFQKKAVLEDQLRFGGYPYLQTITKAEEKKLYLKSIVDDYLFRDVLELKDVSSPETLKKLAILLAFQIGSQVSLNELSRNLGVDVKTVARYLSLLKQSFVIFELSSFSNNPRKEVAKSKKYYFWDLGIRNALTDQFLPIDSRTDLGQLWENFLAVERLKKHEYKRGLKKYYFWRTYEKAEIDWIETREGKLEAFEFKWQKQKSHTPKAFRDAYGVEVHQISKENYLEFLTD